MILLASSLRPEEAGMMQGLLESAGIEVQARDEALSGINPLLQPIVGGVKLAVRSVDLERARELLVSAGALPGLGPRAPAEIPEEEWSRPAGPGNAALEPPPAGRPWLRSPWLARGLMAALLLLALYWGLGF